MNTYQPVKRFVYQSPDGKIASATGAKPEGYELAPYGWTVEIVDCHGAVTRGVHCLRGKSSEAEAVKAALDLAAATNGKYIGIS